MRKRRCLDKKDKAPSTGLLRGYGQGFSDEARQEMLDMILSDDKLTDELVNRLIEKYKERGD